MVRRIVTGLAVVGLLLLGAAVIVAVTAVGMLGVFE